MRDEVFGYLKALPSLRDGTCGKIYEAIIALHETGAPLTYAALHGRLAEQEQEMLAGALLRNESEPPSIAEGMACLEALVEDERGRQRAAIKVRVKEAERAGNFTEALRLSEELSRLQARP